MQHIPISWYIVFFFCCLYNGEFVATVVPNGNIKEHECNVLLASIENMQYAVTVDVLHTVRMIWCLVVNLKIKKWRVI
jgi:hypothetical protein